MGKVILISAGCIVGAIILYKIFEPTIKVEKPKFTYKPKAEEKWTTQKKVKII